MRYKPHVIEVAIVHNYGYLAHYSAHQLLVLVFALNATKVDFVALGDEKVHSVVMSNRSFRYDVVWQIDYRNALII